MAGGSRTPKKSPSKARTSKIRKRVVSKRLIDDEASESDGGVLVEKRALSDRAITPNDLDRYEDNFINDGDPFDGQSDSSDTFPISIPMPPKTPSSGATKRKGPSTVIELASTSEEDLEAMDVDDSMFRKPTALPPSLVTRSQTDMMQYEFRFRVGFIMLMYDRLFSKFMVEYAAAQTGNQGSNDDEPSYSRFPQVDFDELALAKGLAASKAEMRKPIKSDRAGPSRIKASSPPWDPPYHALDDSPSPSRQGKHSRNLRPLAKDLITRMQSGEDVTESLLPDTKAAIPLSLHEYFVKNGSVPATAAAIADPPEPVEVKEEDHPTVFMEQLETYKANYDPLALCGVNDEDLQDPVLKNTYHGQPPLPFNVAESSGDRAILPVFDPARSSGGESQVAIKGGRVRFYTWASHIKDLLADNAIGALLFREAEPNFINPFFVTTHHPHPAASASQSRAHPLWTTPRSRITHGFLEVLNGCSITQDFVLNVPDETIPASNLTTSVCSEALERVSSGNTLKC
ncbi:hypothetical protein B0H14DRAFT_2614084 [Mycena olivaceomarginata]|nr:hypothetical protein B0H14DRAFT_2614084 [Mycena olivaceomarginata]